MEATHHREHAEHEHEHAEHEAHHEHEHAAHAAHEDHEGHEGERPREDWTSEEYVAYWLGREGRRTADRRRQFVMIRSLIPKAPDQEFRYINLGAGPGNLDDVLLEQFP